MRSFLSVTSFPFDSRLLLSCPIFLYLFSDNPTIFGDIYRSNVPRSFIAIEHFSLAKLLI